MLATCPCKEMEKFTKNRVARFRFRGVQTLLLAVHRRVIPIKVVKSPTNLSKISGHASTWNLAVIEKMSVRTTQNPSLVLGYID